LCINDTQYLFNVCQNLFNILAPRHLDGTMSEYLGKVHALLHDFNELMPTSSSPSQQLDQGQSS